MKNFKKNVMSIIAIVAIMATVFAIPGIATSLESVFITRGEWDEFVTGTDASGNPIEKYKYEFSGVRCPSTDASGDPVRESTEPATGYPVGAYVGPYKSAMTGTIKVYGIASACEIAGELAQIKVEEQLQDAMWARKILDMKEFDFDERDEMGENAKGWYDFGSIYDGAAEMPNPPEED